MRVGVDVTSAFGQNTGQETYVLNLVRHLLRHAGEHEVALYAGIPPGGLPTGWEGLRVRPMRAIARDQPHVIHFSDFIVPRAILPPRTRIVLTVHDLFMLTRPRFYEPATVEAFRRRLPPSAARADRIITHSAAVRADIVAQLGVAPERVAVVPLAAAERFHAPVEAGQIAAVRARYGLPGPYVLSVGALVPRKNPLGLIRACELMLERYPASSAHRLVIAGRAAPGSAYQAELERSSAWLRECGAIALPGHVAATDLPPLYAGADLFVFPSFGEGFGIPLLEAMACGVPVVASHAPALPEVAGDAALLVDPADPAAMAAAMHRALTERPLRAALREAGLRRARAFSWERVARETFRVYRQAAGDEHRPAAEV